MWRAAWQVLGPDHHSTLGTSADAIVHDTMAELMEKSKHSGISAIPPNLKSIDAFLWTATRRRALRVVERSRRKKMEPFPEPGEPGELGVEDDLELFEDVLILNQLDSHLHELTDRERRAFIGYYKQGRTHDDIGAELGVTDRGASKLCARAVRKLTAATGIEIHEDLKEKGTDD
ncbi:MAG: sigma-70 family RNA polymerase sigma factor [Acidimicrobiales bacterium]|nr:sigma-70 family RNA polymerase sigma factor [Acidimicrobiales bacterium]